MSTTIFSIDLQFARATRRGRLDEALARWAQTEPSLSGVTAADLLAIRGAEADPLLAGLVRVLQRDRDPLAELVLLKRLLPGALCLFASLRRTSSDDFANLEVGDVVSMLYTCLLRHPIENRPNRIAANVLLDTRQRLTRSPWHRRGWHPVAELEHFTTEADPRAAAALDEIEVEAVVTGTAHRTSSSACRHHNTELARRVLAFGEKPADVSLSLGLPAPVVHQRLYRIRKALAVELSPKRTNRHSPAGDALPNPPTPNVPDEVVTPGLADVNCAHGDHLAPEPSFPPMRWVVDPRCVTPGQQCDHGIPSPRRRSITVPRPSHCLSNPRRRRRRCSRLRARRCRGDPGWPKSLLARRSVRERGGRRGTGGAGSPRSPRPIGGARRRGA